jgi:hypothetical protein
MKTRTPTRDVNGQRSRSIGDFLIGKTTVVLSRTSCNTNLRVPKPRSLANAPPGLHYASGSHAATLVFGTSRIADPRYQSPCRWKPRMSKLRWFGFMPSVPPTIDGSDQIGGSHFAILTCMRSLHSPTPIRRWAMTNDPPCA